MWLALMRSPFHQKRLKIGLTDILLKITNIHQFINYLEIKLWKEYTSLSRKRVVPASEQETAIIFLFWKVWKCVWINLLFDVYIFKTAEITK